MSKNTTTKQLSEDSIHDESLSISSTSTISNIKNNDTCVVDSNKVHVEVIVDEKKPFESTVSSIGKMKTVKSKGDLSKCDVSKSSTSTSILIKEKKIDDLIVKMKDVRHENISKVIIPIKSQWTAPNRSNINTNRFHGGGWGNRVTSNSNMKPVDSIRRHNNVKGTGWVNHSASTSGSTSNPAPDKGTGWGNHSASTSASTSNLAPDKGTGWGNHSSSTSASTSNLAPDKFTPAHTNVTKDRYSNKNNYDLSYEKPQNINFKARNDAMDCNKPCSNEDNVSGNNNHSRSHSNDNTYNNNKNIGRYGNSYNYYKDRH